MKPLVIISAMYCGFEVSMANIAHILMMIDKLGWPLRMLPNFLSNLDNTKRAFRRL